MADNPVGTVVTVVVVGLVIVVGLAVMAPFANDIQSEGAGDGGRVKDAVRLNDGVQWYEIRNGEGTNQTAFDSRGNAIRLNGTPSSTVSGDLSPSTTNFSKDQWSVSQGVWINSSATDQDQVVVALGDPDVMLLYSGSRSEWTAWYASPSGEATVNVSAPSPTTATMLTVVRDGSDLTLHVDNGANATTTVDSGAEIVTDYGNLNGRVDETRINHAALNNSQRQQLVDDPVGPLDPVTEKELRVMYDRGSGESVLTFYDPSGLEHTGEWADGFAGNTLDEKTSALDVSGGNDYRWRTDGPQIRQTTDGMTTSGRLVDAPVVWVNYDYAALNPTNAVGDIADAMELAGVVMVVLIGGLVLAVVNRFR